ncbi:hypothetical protein MWU65_13535 [Cellulophaga sp. F20128]|uniref:hypothetical protein n=1 Tax=Cellulophaga sp. F20128 TaxID=2926413 RepID=UPI001FF44A09|nr:hypothetical protein [Cellulophaga sp. F20128]MCK0158211.1 hypothetical protein [Cellulophaga sp. F20128]
MGQKKDTIAVGIQPKVVFKIEKRTLLEQYEPDLILSAEKRLKLKKARYKDYLLKKGVLDTLQISTAKRKRLLKDLRYKPFSTELSKTLAELNFDVENH